jgi:hypothetical protein
MKTEIKKEVGNETISESMWKGISKANHEELKRISRKIDSS